MASKYRGSEKKERQMEGLCRFHGLESSMSKRPVPNAENRPIGRMSLLDAFQGYHQISLALEDQGKTAFISLDANYHYTVMPFGLKNAGATY